MLHPRPKTKNKGLSDVGKKANFSTEIGAMLFMALADAIMKYKHDLIPLALVKVFYRERQKISGLNLGEQSSTGMNHLVNMLSPELLERYNTSEELIRGLEQESVYIRLRDHIPPKEFYLTGIRSESVRKFIVDPKKHGLKIATLPLHLQPPIGMKM